MSTRTAGALLGRQQREPGTVKIQLVQGVVLGAGRVGKVGEEVDVPLALGRRLIAQGRALEVPKTPSEAPAPKRRQRASEGA